MDEKQNYNSKGKSFVDYIIKRCKQSKGIAASLRRADNPDTEYQSWEFLAPFTDLEKSYQRVPCATIAAAISRAKIEQNGNLGIGRAISRCYEDGKESDQAKAKLRRLLACDSVEEICRILRPLLRLIESRGNVKVDFALLFDQLSRFYWEDQKIKSCWAQDFFNFAKAKAGGEHSPETKEVENDS